MRDRDPGRGRHRRKRRDPGDDLERDPGAGERERLLAAAAEDERVAPFEPHDAARAAVRDEQRVHLVLGERVAGDSQRLGGRLGEELLAGEPVVDEHLRRAQPVEPAHRDQPGIAGARADERDAHPRTASTLRRKNRCRSA